MPLGVILGCPEHMVRMGLKLLRESGAVSVGKAGPASGDRTTKDVLVRGTFKNIADPDGARADLLVQALNLDMKQERFQGIWLDEVEQAPRRR